MQLRATDSPALIFEQGAAGRRAFAQTPTVAESWDDLPPALRRSEQPQLPEVSELQVVRHYTRLSQRNFSI
ncbi:MAG TPA: aminomethyl-transferring glycine dehydrogenase subunit GcvPB, partial [Gammaproteobacteria bacterium]|nr:aminomethyl-transferring glycine dehydrogenase subunit GcvPB [Gammaproteobacteria bacterium]